MRKLNQNIRRRILETSKALFIEHGYMGVSMRMIAKSCQISLGNFYNYFQNKDNLFKEIMNPIISQYYDVQEKQHQNPDIDIVNNFKFEQFSEFINFVDKNKKELKLLFMHSQGSSFEKFKDQFIDDQLKHSFQYLEQMNEKFPESKIDISHLFIKIRCLEWYNIMCLLISDMKITRYEIEKFFYQYYIFSINGWHYVVNKEKEPE